MGREAESGASGLEDVCEHRVKQRRVPERIEHQQERHREGQEIRRFQSALGAYRVQWIFIPHRDLSFREGQHVA